MVTYKSQQTSNIGVLEFRVHQWNENIQIMTQIYSAHGWEISSKSVHSSLIYVGNIDKQKEEVSIKLYLNATTV